MTTHAHCPRCGRTDCWPINGLYRLCTWCGFIGLWRVTMRPIGEAAWHRVRSIVQRAQAQQGDAMDDPQGGGPTNVGV